MGSVSILTIAIVISIQPTEIAITSVVIRLIPGVNGSIVDRPIKHLIINFSTTIGVKSIVLSGNGLIVLWIYWDY